MIINFNLYIYCLKYTIYPDSQRDTLTSYHGKNSLNYNPISVFGLYDTNESYVKLLCTENSTILYCNFLKININNQNFDYFFIGEENFNFIIQKDFTEKNCYYCNFSNEYLFCCAVTDYIKCYRFNFSYFKVKEFKISTQGFNSYLTIKSNNDYATLFFSNYYNDTNSVYEYYIYIPTCQNRNYNILYSLNENKPEEEWEKLSNLFTIKTNKYYFEIKDQIVDFGYFTLNGERINQRTQIRNNISYFLDFINLIVFQKLLIILFLLKMKRHI